MFSPKLLIVEVYLKWTHGEIENYRFFADCTGERVGFPTLVVVTKYKSFIFNNLIIGGEGGIRSPGSRGISTT
jgi:hypothetical protein